MRTKSTQRTKDEYWIGQIAKQDITGETDDSYARTGDALDTIDRWYRSAAQDGDTDLCDTIDRLGRSTAAKLYAKAYKVLGTPRKRVRHVDR